MAQAIRPYAEPRQQLRTEAPRQRPHDDKYVSVFQSGDASVDLTFRDPILSQSADHYAVGVDELTVSLGSLSMLEYSATSPSVLLRVKLRGVDGQHDGANVDGFRRWEMPDGPVGYEEQWRRGFQFTVEKAYTNLSQILKRLDEICTAVNNYINDVGLVNPDPLVAGPYFTAGYQFQANAGVHHFQVMLNANGSIEFRGTRAFWANFVIEVPEAKYQQIFFGTAKQYVSLHPSTGAINANPYTELAGLLLQTNAFAPVVDANGIGFIQSVVYNRLHELEHAYAGGASVMNTLDRRVTIEVSCSLPIKNSPMVDHGKEAPDFALARFLYHRRYTLDTSDAARTLRIQTHDLGAKTLQGPRDRVVFHHLKPQQKIQTLRMRLWARVKTYDEVTNTWGMKTIICPIEKSDYWHARLHFRPK